MSSPVDAACQQSSDQPRLPHTWWPRKREVLRLEGKVWIVRGIEAQRISPAVGHPLRLLAKPGLLGGTVVIASPRFRFVMEQGRERRPQIAKSKLPHPKTEVDVVERD